MTVIGSVHPRINSDRPATAQSSMFRGYVIIVLAVICWAGVIAAAAASVAIFSRVF